MARAVRDGRGDAVADVDAPTPGTRLCRLGDLTDPGGRDFTFGSGPSAFEMFVVRKGDAAFGYRNCCPHAGGPLNWLPGRLLDPSRRHIQCSTHGARFRIESGLCVWGPCQGQSLEVAPVRIEGDAILVAGQRAQAGGDD